MPARRQINRATMNSYFNNGRLYKFDTANSVIVLGKPMRMSAFKAAAMKFDAKFESEAMDTEFYTVRKTNEGYEIL